jgi:DNA-binding response OmpR family regulator
MACYKRQRILLVDDEPQATALLEFYLQTTEAYEVRTVNSSSQAVCVAKEFRPDLILLDVNMPGTDGGELVSQFLDSPRLRKVPVIFLTGAYSKEQIARNGNKLGGIPALAKPVKLMELLEFIRAHLPLAQPVAHARTTDDNADETPVALPS